MKTLLTLTAIAIAGTGLTVVASQWSSEAAPDFSNAVGLCKGARCGAARTPELKHPEPAGCGGQYCNMLLPAPPKAVCLSNCEEPAEEQPIVYNACISLSCG